MVRMQIKGGVWRNTEDEILKAAVMKYGLNQWSRIASLLHRKAAKQCKARWYEWLDPNIKKTEWSREEEEKLLHLAKLMPTQWRTIAPIIGRTASQCLEYYEYLLDKAADREAGLEGGEDPRKLKPGEIDPNPETKPARPDPVDMDEDELEMLSEARARLANTQGKKAKRKAREKQLEEARRLALIQKRREMRAAGIRCRLIPSLFKRNKRAMVNYNEEIPFKKSVPKGFYDTGDDDFNPEDKDFKKLTQRDIEPELHSQKEARERRKDQQRMKDLRENNMEHLLKRREVTPWNHRNKLVLPSPQITDDELHEVVKLGKASQQAKELVNEGNDQLLSDYSTMTPSRTLGTGGGATPAAPASEAIHRQAQHILALNETDSALKGGVNTFLETGQQMETDDQEENIGDFTGVTPARQAQPTPNQVIATPFRTPGMTPGGAPAIMTPGQTPVRDKLGLNNQMVTPDGSMTPADFDNDQREQLQNLKIGLSSLPQPKNDFEIVLPEELPDGMHAEELDGERADAYVQDMGDEEEKYKQELERRRQEELNKRHTSLKKGLPRPSAINETVMRKSDVKMNELQEAEELIKREMITMLHNDALNYPAPNQISSKQNKRAQLPASHVAYLERNMYEEVSKEDLEEAREVLLEEVLYVKQEMDHGEVTIEAFDQVWNECFDEVLFLPNEKRYTRAMMASKKDKVDSFEKRLEINRTHMKREAKRATKMEKNLKIKTGGYRARSNELLKNYETLTNDVELAQRDLNVFQLLNASEQGAIPRRKEILELEVNRQRIREQNLQKMYADAQFEFNKLTNNVNEYQTDFI